MGLLVIGDDGKGPVSTKKKAISAAQGKGVRYEFETAVLGALKSAVGTSNYVHVFRKVMKCQSEDDLQPLIRELGAASVVAALQETGVPCKRGAETNKTSAAAPLRQRLICAWSNLSAARIALGTGQICCTETLTLDLSSLSELHCAADEPKVGDTDNHGDNDNTPDVDEDITSGLPPLPFPPHARLPARPDPTDHQPNYPKAAAPPPLHHLSHI